MVEGINRKSANNDAQKQKPWSRSKVVFSCETASGIVWSTKVNIEYRLLRAKNLGLGITFPNFWKLKFYLFIYGRVPRDTS